MSIEIKPVENLQELKQFVLFPYSLYNNHEFWVPPLIRSELEEMRSDINPAFEHCEARFVVAYKNDRIVGRIAGIVNHLYIQHWQKKLARFYWFDFIDDFEVSGALLKDIEQWALSKGLDGLIGPMGFTSFEKQGVLVEGFDELPTISSAYNFAYYSDHLVRHGYAKEKDYLEYVISVPDDIPEKSVQIADMVASRYHLRALKAKSKKELLTYTRQVFKVINHAYQSIHGFVPLTPRQIDYTVHRFSSIIMPDYTTAVLNENDQVVGFQIAMPSLSHAFQKAKGKLFPFGFIHIANAIRKPSKIDLLLVGVLPEYLNKGVNAFFMNAMNRICLQKKIRYAESNGILEDNLKIQTFRKYFNARQHKRRRLYVKSLRDL